MMAAATIKDPDNFILVYLFTNRWNMGRWLTDVGFRYRYLPGLASQCLLRMSLGMVRNLKCAPGIPTGLKRGL